MQKGAQHAQNEKNTEADLLLRQLGLREEAASPPPPALEADMARAGPSLQGSTSVTAALGTSSIRDAAEEVTCAGRGGASTDMPAATNPATAELLTEAQFGSGEVDTACDASALQPEGSDGGAQCANSAHTGSTARSSRPRLKLPPSPRPGDVADFSRVDSDLEVLSKTERESSDGSTCDDERADQPASADSDMDVRFSGSRAVALDQRHFPLTPVPTRAPFSQPSVTTLQDVEALLVKLDELARVRGGLRADVAYQMLENAAAGCYPEGWEPRHVAAAREHAEILHALLTQRLEDEAAAELSTSPPKGTVRWYRLHKDDPIAPDSSVSIFQAAYCFLRLKLDGKVPDAVFARLLSFTAGRKDACAPGLLPSGNTMPRCRPSSLRVRLL